MPRTVKPARAASKKATEADFGKSRNEFRWFSPIALELRKIFPRNCAAEIAARAGRSVRACEFWLAGAGVPDGEALARLLRSDIGDRLHGALIASVKAPWADNLRAVREMARIRQQQAEHARRLAELEGSIR